MWFSGFWAGESRVEASCCRVWGVSRFGMRGLFWGFRFGLGPLGSGFQVWVLESEFYGRVEA